MTPPPREGDYFSSRNLAGTFPKLCEYHAMSSEPGKKCVFSGVATTAVALFWKHHNARFPPKNRCLIKPLLKKQHPTNFSRKYPMSDLDPQQCDGLDGTLLCTETFWLISAVSKEHQFISIEILTWGDHREVLRPGPQEIWTQNCFGGCHTNQ